ncbi:MAG: hypothetical protein H7Y17_03370, partial [Chlorobia bacterium]|nr:hypothetical protein [Fimbriimonadaceae bacterium]
MTKVSLAWLCTALPIVSMASTGDEQAIRKLYKLRDRGYNQRDVRALRSMEVATFYAIDPGA